MPTPVVSGVGEFHPLRKSGRQGGSIIHHAIREAISDAGLTAAQIDGVVTEAKITPNYLDLDHLAPSLGLTNLRYQALSSPVAAGIFLAFAMAAEAVRAGLATHVLTYFGVDWGSNGSGPAGLHAAMTAKREVEYPAGFRGPPLYFGALAERYANIYGLSQDELVDLLAGVALSARRNAGRHEFAQKRAPLSMEDYLAEDFIAQPLRRSDVSLLSDGAVAFVVSAADAVAPDRRTVTLAGWGHAVQPIADEAFYSQSRELPDLPATRNTAEQARARAGFGPESVDLANVYDCFSIATVIQIEALGIVKPGATASLIGERALDVDGSCPVNTHGGLLAHGYILGANHLSEAVRQLRHEALGNQVPDVSKALVGGGPGRQYTTLLLKRTDD